jgi:hypothetical protein
VNVNLVGLLLLALELVARGARTRFYSVACPRLNLWPEQLVGGGSRASTIRNTVFLFVLCTPSSFWYHRLLH